MAIAVIPTLGVIVAPSTGRSSPSKPLCANDYSTAFAGPPAQQIGAPRIGVDLDHDVLITVALTGLVDHVAVAGTADIRPRAALYHSGRSFTHLDLIMEGVAAYTAAVTPIFKKSN